MEDDWIVWTVDRIDCIPHATFDMRHAIFIQKACDKSNEKTSRLDMA